MREGISQNRRTTKLDPLLVVTDGALGPDPHCRDLLPADAPPAVPRPPTALGPIPRRASHFFTRGTSALNMLA